MAILIYSSCLTLFNIYEYIVEGNSGLVENHRFRAGKLAILVHYEKSYTDLACVRFELNMSGLNARDR